ncbi:MAG: hypothetical protein RL219_2414 [Actinomycetota bacterium]|jgi:pimeloyl-ACP methyl ester carboxylesterase
MTMDVFGARLGEPGMQRVMTLTEAFATSAVGAGALRIGLHYEAWLRNQQHAVLKLVEATTGVSSRQLRWEAAERAERERRAPDRKTALTGAPHVFWHGPDRVSGDRPVLVMVNGWTASGLMWPEQVVRALEQHFDVIRIDNRGAGYSRTAPAPFTVGDMADDVTEVMDAIGASTATLLGLSMGGMIAQDVAMRHPTRVERLVLCGTRPPSPAGFLPSMSVMTSVMSSPRPGEAIHDYFARLWGAVVAPGFAQQHPEVMSEIADAAVLRPTPHAGVMSQMRAISSWYGSARLGRIAVPTTVIHGAADPLIPVGNGMRLAQLIPGAEYHEMPNVGHLVPYEAPDVVIEAALAR